MNYPKVLLEKRFDPVVIGPGYWISIHTRSANIKNLNDEQNFIVTVYNELENFPCLNCRNHALEYWNKHDINAYREMINNKGQLIGMAEYFYEFHNAVNYRLGKPLMPHDIFESIYINKTFGVCTKNCGSNISENNINKPEFFKEKNITSYKNNQTGGNSTQSKGLRIRPDPYGIYDFGESPQLGSYNMSIDLDQTKSNKDIKIINVSASDSNTINKPRLISSRRNIRR